jgi:hypothetical protein
MKYDFVEIGTSDFNSPSQENYNLSGVCVEPIKYYLDRLPNSKTIIKENSAISNFNGFIEIFYINDENIKKYNLPFWIRGCNKIGDYHPTALKEILSKNIGKEIFTIEKIKVITYENLMLKYDCRQINYLKIDTEGHDHIIINEMYNFYSNNIDFYLPKKINFETFSGILSTQEEINNSKNLLEKLGYYITKETGSDVFMDLIEG